MRGDHSTVHRAQLQEVQSCAQSVQGQDRPCAPQGTARQQATGRVADLVARRQALFRTKYQGIAALHDRNARYVRGANACGQLPGAGALGCVHIVDSGRIAIVTRQAGKRQATEGAIAIDERIARDTISRAARTR